MDLDKAIQMERDKLRKLSRYPYTYACDAVRNALPEVSSRSDASALVSRRAEELCVEVSDLAKSLAEDAISEMAISNLASMARNACDRQVRNILGLGD